MQSIKYDTRYSFSGGNDISSARKTGMKLLAFLISFFAFHASAQADWKGELSTLSLRGFFQQMTEAEPTILQPDESLGLLTFQNDSSNTPHGTPEFSHGILVIKGIEGDFRVTDSGDFLVLQSLPKIQKSFQVGLVEINGRILRAMQVAENEWMFEDFSAKLVYLPKSHTFVLLGAGTATRQSKFYDLPEVPDLSEKEAREYYWNQLNHPQSEKNCPLTSPM